jgi:hypothetical protein
MTQKKRRSKTPPPTFFYLGSRLVYGYDPRKDPVFFYHWSEDDWAARRDGEITEEEYNARYRIRRRLNLKGSDPLPSADLIEFPPTRIVRPHRVVLDD